MCSLILHLCGLRSGALPVLVKALVLAPSLAFLACTLLVALVHGDQSRMAVLARLQGPLHLSQWLETSAVHSLATSTGDNIKLTLSAALTDSNATCKSCVMQTAPTIAHISFVKVVALLRDMCQKPLA